MCKYFFELILSKFVIDKYVIHRKIWANIYVSIIVIEGKLMSLNNCNPKIVSLIKNNVDPITAGNQIQYFLIEINVKEIPNKNIKANA